MNRGEFGPRMEARTDFASYPLGCKTLENFLPLPQGGAMRRPGTVYVAATKDGANTKARLLPFEVAEVQAYLLEMGESYFRFYKDQGQITVATTDAAITNGTFDSDLTGWSASNVTQSSGAALFAASGTLDQTVTIDSAYTAVEHVIRFRVVGVAGESISLDIDSGTYGDGDIVDTVTFAVGYHCYAFTPGGTTLKIRFATGTRTASLDDVEFLSNTPLEIVNPYSDEDDHRAFKYAQSADVMYLCHQSYAVHTLSRSADSSWSLTEVLFDDGPYFETNTTSTTLLPSAATGEGINLTLSSIVGVNDNLGWQSGDVGRLVRYKKSSAWGYAQIVSITSTTVAKADVLGAFEATPTAQTTWRLGTWCGTTGHPGAVVFHEQRLAFGGTTAQPQTFWLSQSADFENMTPDNRDTDNDESVESDDALDFTISADQVNAIRWLTSAKQLLIGTTGGEWVVSSSGSVLTPTDIDVKRQTTFGSASIAPVLMRARLLFVQRAARKLIEFVFDFQIDNYQGFDQTLLADHVTKGGILETAYQQELDSTLWCVRNDGQVPTLTYQPDQEVIGWARQIAGGVFDVAITRVWQVDASGPTYVDETTDANDAGSADWTVFPSSEAVNDYAAFGYTEPFRRMTFDYAGGTAGVGGAVAWEYWNGTEWLALDDLVDNTTGFTATAADSLTVTWTVPDDWQKKSINSSGKLYYVRARVTTVYTTTPVLDQGYIGGPAVIESVAVIPGSSADEVWFSVKRTINGATVRYVEYLAAPHEEGDDKEDAIYADSAISYSGAATTSFSNADHLEGEICAVLADGAVHPDVTIASGAFTLDYAAATVHIGLKHKSTYESLKWEAGSASGTAQGQTKRIHGVTLVLHDSEVARVGPSMDKLVDVPFREVADEMDTFVPLFTGEKFVEFDGDYMTDTRVMLQTDAPVPFMLLAVAPVLKTNQR